MEAEKGLSCRMVPVPLGQSAIPPPSSASFPNYPPSLKSHGHVSCTLFHTILISQLLSLDGILLLLSVADLSK